MLVAPPGVPAFNGGINFSPCYAKKAAIESGFKLPDQGSNLDSSDSESDVLPVTPSGKSGAKIEFYS